MSNGMQVPEWADDLRPRLEEKLSSTNSQVMASIRDLCRITNYSTFFAEWEKRGNDLILHLFPRSGPDDAWEAGRYILRCRKCDRERRPEEVEGPTRQPCKCGSTGLVYIPGRVENKGDVGFPLGMKDILFKAVDSCWLGPVAIENIPELGAYAVQLPGAWGKDEQKTIDLMEKIFGELDIYLEE